MSARPYTKHNSIAIAVPAPGDSDSRLLTGVQTPTKQSVAQPIHLMEELRQVLRATQHQCAAGRNRGGNVGNMTIDRNCWV
jgi:hypothetical protein